MKNKKILIASIMNILMFCVVLCCVMIDLFDKTHYANMGVNSFKFFTIDSNIFCAICSLLIGIFEIFILINKKEEVPYIIYLFKFISTLCVTITFLTVMLFLFPTQGAKAMFGGTNGFLHLLSPLLAIISYLFLEFHLKKDNIYIKSLYAFIPVFIYAIIYLILVVIVKKWDDFYGFNKNGMWYLFLIGMSILTYALSLGLEELHILIKKKVYKED